jgi:hypothetical protein
MGEIVLDRCTGWERPGRCRGGMPPMGLTRYGWPDPWSWVTPRPRRGQVWGAGARKCPHLPFRPRLVAEGSSKSTPAFKRRRLAR